MAKINARSLHLRMHRSDEVLTLLISRSGSSVFVNVFHQNDFGISQLASMALLPGGLITMSQCLDMDPVEAVAELKEPVSVSLV